MIPAQVGFIRPASVEEALEALGEPEAKVLAGGQSLVPALKLRLARPSVLVDVGGLDVRGISRQNGEVRVGALTTWDDLLGSQELAGPGLAAIPECAAGIGDLQVRNVGTLGGGLAHADPASDMPAVALALGMQVRVRSAARERTIAPDELFLGPFTTALEPHELITEVVVPEPPAGSGSAYVSVENPASGFAVAGAAALVLADGTSRVAVTGIGGRPFLTSSVSDVTVPEYRAHLMDVVVRRATELARARASGEAP